MIEQIETILDVNFKNPKLIENALYHTTYVNENSRLNLTSNERLEFLGDAVLELTVSDFLYRTYQELPEGKLTMMRAQLVQESSLAYLARQLKINDKIYLGKGEIVTGGRKRDSILADAYEAILGAIYLDQGIDIARKFVNLTMLAQHQVIINTVSKDFKTALQERVQQRGSVKIQYSVIEQTGPAHDTYFKVGIAIDGQKIAVGEGRSKKIAEIEAAKFALNKIDERGFIKKTNK